MKKLWILMIALLVALPLLAQEVEVREDHPEEYVVQEGDTLWDIAGRFLTRPWQWPAIWQANPEIDNPHLIYPGDRLSLVYIDGQPRLVRDGSRRLSPEIRATPTTGPITTVPLAAIEPFLVKPRVVGRDELASLPYVVANEELRYIAAEPNRVFVRGLSDNRKGDQVTISRLSFQFHEIELNGRNAVRQNLMRGNMGAVPADQRPIKVGGRLNPFSRDGKIIGYQLWEVARAEVLATGDPATLEIVESDIEVRAGDYVLPIDPYLYDLTFFPGAPDFEIPAGASVIGIEGGSAAVGHYQIVALDIGSNVGVKPGHTFSVFHRGRKVEDDFYDGLRGRPAPTGSSIGGRSVQLPEQFTGRIMVFRSFEKVSYALVMTGKRGVRVGDLIDHPDRRL
ncbi:MAG: LysM domain-containing protein [Wenzhouxiangellaceae bacterium]|nr:LysM domain-containing protein [Wenzhouxiangellaceae bacterium]